MSPLPPLPTDEVQASPEAVAPVPGGWHRRVLASFAVSNYRWFFFGQGTSVVGLWMRSAAQSWLVYDLTRSELLLGVVAAASQASLGALSPVGGALADRVDKRRLLIRVGIASSLLSLALAALVFTGSVEVWHVLVLASLSGAVKGFEIPARQAFVVEMVGREHLPNAIALNTAMFNSARVIGPAVAGWLFDALAEGVAVCFLVDGLSYFAIVFSLTRIRPLPLPFTPDDGGWRDRVRAGFAFARGSLRVRTLLTLLAIFIAFGWSYIAIMPAFTRDVLGMGGRGYGALMAVNGFGALLGAVYVAGTTAPPSRRALRRHVFGAIALSAASLTAFALCRDPVPAGAALVAQGFGAIAFLSRGNSLVQMAVPDHLRGRVMSLWVLCFIGALAAGGLLVGTLAEVRGPAPALAASGLLCILLSALVFLRLPPVREE